ncbi:MAG: hypothetical protein NTW12_10010 [Deltaproteobacteria bacterium]|nr:hypothetical protein [Deltaproteobacteria bacterium]
MMTASTCESIYRQLIYILISFGVRPITYRPSDPSGTPVADGYFIALHNDRNLPNTAGNLEHLL